MKFAITGATGFVGSEILRQARRSGHEAVPIVRQLAGLPGEVVAGDLSVAPAAGALEDALGGCSAVVHLAARTHVTHETAPDVDDLYYRVNVAGTAALLDAAIASSIVRFVFMSSIKAVGEYSDPGSPLAPDTLPRPEDAYGRSKLAAEALVRERCDAAGIEWTIIRPPLVYGSRAKGNLDRLGGLVRRRVPLPFGAVGNARSMVSARNLAAGTIMALTSPTSVGRILHLADLTLSTGDLVREVGKSLGTEVTLVRVAPWLMNLAASALGRGEDARRLLGSLEVDSRESWKALGVAKPNAFPFDPREELRASFSESLVVGRQSAG